MIQNSHGVIRNYSSWSRSLCCCRMPFLLKGTVESRQVGTHPRTVLGGFRRNSNGSVNEEHFYYFAGRVEAVQSVRQISAVPSESEPSEYFLAVAGFVGYQELWYRPMATENAPRLCRVVRDCHEAKWQAGGHIFDDLIVRVFDCMCPNAFVAEARSARRRSKQQPTRPRRNLNLVMCRSSCCTRADLFLFTVVLVPTQHTTAVVLLCSFLAVQVARVRRRDGLQRCRGLSGCSGQGGVRSCCVVS